MNQSIQEIVEDLRSLIDEINTHPNTSAWAIRRVLRGIVEKAERKMEQQEENQAYQVSSREY